MDNHVNEKNFQTDEKVTIKTGIKRMVILPFTA